MRNNVTKLELPLLVLFPSILYGLLIYLQLMMKVLYSTYIQPGTLKVTSIYSIKYSGLAKVTWSITASNLAFVVHIYILTCSFILFLLFNLFKFKFLHVFLLYYSNNHLFKKTSQFEYLRVVAILGYFGGSFLWCSSVSWELFNPFS